MAYSKVNASSATMTSNRTPKDVSLFSGMCATCIEGCTGLCEVGKSAFRSSEVIYPQPFGPITAASQKDYPVDWSHFNIHGTAVGAYGIKADSDMATFPNVNIEAKICRGKGIKLKMPIIIPGLGSTDVAKRNWDGLGIGAAISGIALTIGENVCGMDVNSEIKKGRVVKAPDLMERVKLYRGWQDGYGEVILQANVEDTRLGVHEYGLEKLGIEAVELKWGQGAKTIGGEVKINDLAKAQLLKKRGYIVLPDPEDPTVISAFRLGAFKEFERHSRVGMVNEEEFCKRVEELRALGAKYVFLKTGAYRPADLARALKFSSLAKIDFLTVDGAGGGTGMSPWRMMNEWGIPTVYIESLLYNYAKRLAEKGAYIPDIAVAGGFILEDQIFKGLALGAPYIKAIGMARGPIAAVMVAKTLGRFIADENVPTSIQKYGKTVDEIFVTAAELKKKYGRDFADIPVSAIGLYSYAKRLAQGLQQLMAGARKFALRYITRDDICTLTRDAAEVSGITYVMDVDREEVEKILS
ncbi:MAG: FMN-binding glutamate synthase family protein [candidate division NC10 bacterium]|nr:FMN-binding glutamate synthase family protein [candidate division NC10 bacterium]